eukprot:956687-Amorphochlora_amoeboformis.AAC.2
MTSRRSGKEGVKESGMVVREDPRGVQAGEYGGRPGGTRRERGTLSMCTVSDVFFADVNEC